MKTKIWNEELRKAGACSAALEVATEWVDSLDRSSQKTEAGR